MTVHGDIDDTQPAGTERSARGAGLHLEIGQLEHPVGRPLDRVDNQVKVAQKTDLHDGSLPLTTGQHAGQLIERVRPNVE